ncbi:hypothetical protein V5E97_11445 [Singulisphaera sp. Ch08]|uniref:Uncharacterized protein n=1 Tax=Singulisphaera sp. Ch08 TaxID=3120278 RepID=A0AAU7CN14_9BACT
MQDKLSRRVFIQMAGASSLAAIGCDVKDAPTVALVVAEGGLRVYQIVAVWVGEKLLALPHPAARISGVALVASAVPAELTVAYLDRELQRREIRVILEEERKIAVEGKGSVTLDIDYLDLEHQPRKARGILDEAQKIDVESKGSVTFVSGHILRG